MYGSCAGFMPTLAMVAKPITAVITVATTPMIPAARAQRDERLNRRGTIISPPSHSLIANLRFMTAS